MTDDYTLDLAVLLQALRKGRKTIFLSIGGSLFLAILIMLFTRPVYRAEVTFVAVDVESSLGDSVGLEGSPLKALAGLSGANLGGQSAVETNLFLLESHVFSTLIAEELGMAKYLFASRWNQEKGSWGERGKISAAVKNAVWSVITFFSDGVAPVFLNDDSPPTSLEVFEQIEEIRLVIIDPVTGITTLRFEWEDPAIATNWANEFVRIADRQLRSISLAESERRIDFLEQEMASAKLEGVRNALVSVVLDQLNRSMMAKTSEHFAFKIIDPAIVSERPFKPRLMLSLILAILFGAGVGAAWILLRQSHLGRTLLDSSGQDQTKT